MYSMVTIVTNIVLHIWKLIRVYLNSPHHKKKLTTVMDANYIYCGAHFVMYINTESCCTPKINIVLETNVMCQWYLSKKFFMDESEKRMIF